MASSIAYKKAMGQSWHYAEKLYLTNSLLDELDAESFSAWRNSENGKRLLELVQKGPADLAACLLEESERLDRVPCKYRHPDKALLGCAATFKSALCWYAGHPDSQTDVLG